MLRRLTRLALITGGLAGALVPMLHPGHGPGYYSHPLTSVSHLLLFAAVLILSLGLPGLVAFGTHARGPAVFGAAALFVGLWCLDGIHGVIDGAVLPTLAAAEPAVATLLASGHPSQDLLVADPLGVLTSMGVPAFILGSLLLGAALVRARRLPRVAGWAVALAWVLMPPSFMFPILRAPGVALPYLALAIAGALLMLRDVAPARATAVPPSASVLP